MDDSKFVAFLVVIVSEREAGEGGGGDEELSAFFLPHVSTASDKHEVVVSPDTDNIPFDVALSFATAVSPPGLRDPPAPPPFTTSPCEGLKHAPLLPRPRPQPQPQPQLRRRDSPLRKSVRRVEEFETGRESLGHDIGLASLQPCEFNPEESREDNDDDDGGDVTSTEFSDVRVVVVVWAALVVIQHSKDAERPAMPWVLVPASSSE